MDKQSSDERLLKLIEGQYSTPTLEGQQILIPKGQKPPIKKIGEKFNLNKLLFQIKHLKIDLVYINKGLISAALFLVLVFLFTIFTPPGPSLLSLEAFNSASSRQIEELINAGQKQASLRNSVSFKDIKRNVFLPFNTSYDLLNPQDATDLSEEIKALKLVGIIWSANPEVMIENEKDTRTYILKKGDTFNESYKVKNITRNSVTLQVSTQDGLKDYELR